MKKLSDLFIVFNAWLDSLDNKHPTLTIFLGAFVLVAFCFGVLASVEMVVTR